jgi:hypothetical protein
MGSLAETILPDVSVLETNEPPTAQLRPAAAG